MATKIGYAKYRLSPLKKITDEAKRIRKAKPSMQWKDAVKQAAKKYNLGAKAAPIKKKVARKVSGPSKPASKHKDVKSHNVKIDIVSGRKADAVNKSISQLRMYSQLCGLEEYIKRGIERNKDAYKLAKTTEAKKRIKSNTEQLRKQLAVVRQQKSLQKKLI